MSAVKLGYDQQSQYYAEHLGELNKTNEVVSTEDIVSSRGILIARSGARIDIEVSRKLLRHKLAKPLYSQVSIKDRINSGNLKEEYQRLYARMPDLVMISDASGLREEFDDMVLGYRLPRLLAQNLTVLRERKRQVFDQALFTALLSVLIARKLELTPTEVRAAYIAGLVHDMGLLHIAPRIVDKKEDLTADEWRAIQSHVVIGQMLVQQVADEVPPVASVAVLEHHERCDCSGYPTGASGRDLHVLGQIIAITDSLEAVRVNQFQRWNLNLASAGPFLQMNCTTHFFDVYEALHNLIKRSGLKPVTFNPYETLELFAHELLQRTRVLERALPALEAVNKVVDDIKLPYKYRSLRRIPSRVIHMIHASGLLRGELCEWLAGDAIGSGDDVLHELNDIELLQNELRWQLANLQRVLNEYLVKNKDGHSAHPILQKALTELRDCLGKLRN